MRGVWITPIDDLRQGRRVAVKDLFDTAGVRTTYGSRVFADHVPERSATAVLRLEDAGYVNAGKTNLHEFAYGITSQNPHYGTVPNPRFPGRTAGGSSGGSAAAVVTGEADIGLGSDSGGSIRIPAACCALAGFKPSFGLVPTEGAYPLAPSFDHAGPIASDVAGCTDAMAALAPGVARTRPGLEGVRFAVAWLDDAERGVRERIAAVADSVGAEGVELPRASAVFPAFQREIAEVHRGLFPRERDAYGRNVATKIAVCMDVTDDEDAAARAARERRREALGGLFERFDLLLTPTLPIVPPPADCDELEVRVRMTQNTFPLNATGAPALAMPCGTTPEGLPVSLQVVGPPGADAAVLAAGAALEEPASG